jgi:DNA-directed RNA polymerase subunit RPC12/RpoP
MKCPTCGSENVRASQRSSIKDVFFRAAAQQAYRCRDCRARFYLAENKADRHHASGQRSRKKRKRKLVEIAIFVAMLAIFLLFLRYLTQERAPRGDGAVFVTGLRRVLRRRSRDSE